MAERVRGWIVAPTGLFIRDYLLEHGEGYPQEMWRALKEARGKVKHCTYQSFRVNYIYVLKKLGLIEAVRHVRIHPKWFERIYYRIVPGMEDDSRWAHPQIAFDPRRGKPAFRRKYARARAKKLAPKPLPPEELNMIWEAASAFIKQYGYVLTREQFETVKPEWPSEAQLYATFDERVGYAVRQTVEIEYVSRLARRLIKPEEAPEPFATEARKVGKTLEREWLRRHG